MSEAGEPENLMLVMLRRLDVKMDRVMDELADIRLRQSETQIAVTALRRDQNADASAVARMQVNMDRMRNDIDRIMRRLDVVE
ncbi:hypothetical protein TSH7_10105 [Azospirillum sp. TSH7]|uniref:hypothetical protein n=1 Tax=unclassified Azospirillum TaxID=2630922 RepID=UPI000D604066|nr:MULTISPECIES: hypothetical protein [unclassified Azospirillum]PWC64019.1 hypothetical protein TSH20_19200 [Azospirillum sp. TSH20]PWC64882.1 hypothetical protein TSH7_10105 [Azospirillum sp. TSH7]